MASGGGWNHSRRALKQTEHANRCLVTDPWHLLQGTKDAGKTIHRPFTSCGKAWCAVGTCNREESADRLHCHAQTTSILPGGCCSSPVDRACVTLSGNC